MFYFTFYQMNLKPYLFIYFIALADTLRGLEPNLVNLEPFCDLLKDLMFLAITWQKL